MTAVIDDLRPISPGKLDMTAVVVTHDITSGFPYWHEDDRAGGWQAHRNDHRERHTEEISKHPDPEVQQFIKRRS